MSKRNGFTLFSVLLFMLILIFSFQFSTATSNITDIPDICIPTNYTYYDINLTEYINFHVNDVCYLWAKDPLYINTSGHYLQLPAGYQSLFTYYYEASYYFNAGHDWLRFFSYPTNETYLDASSPLSGNGLQFWCCQEGDCGSKYYHNVFALNISDECSAGGGGGGGGGGSGTLDPDRLTLYYDLDSVTSNVTIDLVGNANGTADAPDLNSSSQVPNPNAYEFDQAYGDYVYISHGAWNSFGTDPFTINFWFRNDESSYNGYAGKGTTAPDYGWAIQSHGSNGRMMFKDDAGNTICTGTTDTRDSQWRMATITRSNTSTGGTQIYIDSVVEAGCDSASDNYDDTDLMYLGYFSYGQYLDGALDEFAVWNKSLNQSQIDELYNSGNGCFYDCITNASGGGGGGGDGAPVLNSSIPDQAMSQSTYKYVNLDDYFWNWSDMYVLVDDPLNEYQYQIWTGYCTLNADYYDVCMYANGTLQIQSYARPWNETITAYACNGVDYDVCTWDPFELSINGTLSGVIDLNPFLSPISLGDSVADRVLYSGNYYFQYYDEIEFIYNESNATGILTDTFPFEIVDVAGDDYQVRVNCTIDQDTYYYSFTGDINVSLECGYLQSYFYLAYAGVDFGELVYFNASNSVNSSYDGFYLATSNVTNITSFHTLGIVEHNDTRFRNFSDDFSSFFDASEDEQTKFAIVWIVLGSIAVGTFFLLFAFVPFKFIAYTVLGLWALALGFFSNVGYVEYSTVVMYIGGLTIVAIIKLFRGGA